MVRRACWATKPDGTPCRAAPLTEGDYCLMHSPEHAEEVQEARRLGGLRRRREVTVQGAYERDGLRSVDGLLRVLEIAVLDTLGLDNSVARARTLGYLVGVGLKALEVGELEARLGALEAAVRARPRIAPSPLDDRVEDVEFAEAAS